jgi:L-lactate dehydrogenase complex protein LldG
MSSREQILTAVKANQPAATNLPSLVAFETTTSGELSAFRKVVEGLRAILFEIPDYAAIAPLLQEHYPHISRIIAVNPAYYPGSDQEWESSDAHDLRDVDMAIIPGQWGVAENGAIWMAEQDMKVRVLPFICQHLAIVLSKNKLVATMHQAYEKIGAPDAGFGVFIAGPSKTADIEQSLVLGAHGAKSLAIFVVE